MKKLINVVPKVEGNKLTVTAEIAEWEAREFQFPVQQTTIGFVNPENLQWPRHIQLSQEATFVKAYGNCMAMRHEDLIAIASLVEPKTTYPPKFKKNLDDGLTADISSELNPEFQWQVTDSVKDGNWSNVTGQTSKTLDREKILKGKFYRLVATSDAGEMISNPVLVK